jgi:hypothetical protein
MYVQGQPFISKGEKTIADLCLKKSVLWQIWFENIQQKSCCLPYHIPLQMEEYKPRHATKLHKTRKANSMLLAKKTGI